MTTKRLLLYMITLCLLSSFSFAWWNGTWEHRQLVNISNTARNLTDYQVRVNLNTNNVGDGFNWSNGGFDLRFSNTTDDGLYDYWIEDWNNITNTSLIYIKVDGLFANNTNKIIYMYYGNNNAIKASTDGILDNIKQNAEESYNLDHFSDDLIGNASIVQFTLNSTIFKGGSYSYKLNGTAGKYIIIYINNTWTNSTNELLQLEWWQITPGEQDFPNLCFNFDPVTISGYCAGQNSNLNANNNFRTRIYRITNGSIYELASNLYAGDRFTWTRVVTRMNSLGSWNSSFYNEAGTYLGGHSVVGYNTYQTGGIALLGYIGTPTPQPIYWDNITRISGYGKQTQLALPLMGLDFGDEENTTANTPPVAYSYILPSDVYLNDTMMMYCNGSDNNGDNLSYSYWIYNNYQLIYNATTGYYTEGEAISVYNQSLLNVGDVWTIECRAFDSEDYSDISTNFTIILEYNNVPNIMYANLTPDNPFTFDDLLGYCRANDTDYNLYEYGYGYKTYYNYSNPSYNPTNPQYAIDGNINTYANYNSLDFNFINISKPIKNVNITELRINVTIRNYYSDPFTGFMRFYCGNNSNNKYAYSNDHVTPSFNPNVVFSVVLNFTYALHKDCLNAYEDTFVLMPQSASVDAARLYEINSVEVYSYSDIEETYDKFLYEWKWYQNGALFADNSDRIEYNGINITRSTTFFHDVQYKDGFLYTVIGLPAASGDKVYVYYPNGTLYSTINPNNTNDPGPPVTDWFSIKWVEELNSWFLVDLYGSYLHIFDETWNETSVLSLNTGDCEFGLYMTGIEYYNGFIYGTHYVRSEITKYYPNGTCIGLLFDANYNHTVDIEYYDGFFYIMDVYHYNNTLFVYNPSFQLVYNYTMPNLSDVPWYAGFDIYNNTLYTGSYGKNIYGFNFTVLREYNTSNGEVLLDTIGNTSTEVGDNWTFACRAFDGWGYSSWDNDTVTIQSSTSILSLNVTPQYPISTIDDINCTFEVNEISANPVNVTVKWYNSTDLTIWDYASTYTYTYVNILINHTYITNASAGSIPKNIYKNYTHWKCEITVNVLNDETKQNSSVIDIYPTENLTIYSPANNTFSPNTLTTYFSVIDYDGTINCRLNVNGSFVATNASTINGSNTSLSYINPTNDYYTWYIRCDSNENDEYKQSGYYSYLYDSNAPTFSNYYNSTSLVFPEINDSVNLSVNIDDNFEIDVCKLQILDDGTGWRNETVYNINSPSYYLSALFVVRNVSTANNSIVYWSVWCNDSTGNEVVSTIKSFTVVDTTFPIIVNNPNNIFYNNSNKVISGRLYDLNYTFTYIDYNLFQAEVNITCDISGQIHYWHNLNISTTNFTIINGTDLEGLPPQPCTIFTAASDDHTDKIIPAYDVNLVTTSISKKKEKGKDKTEIVESRKEKYKENGVGNALEFNTEAKNNIKIIGDNSIENVKINKKTDRYNMEFEYNDEQTTREFYVTSDKPIYYRSNSEYPAHFVVWNEKAKKGNWIDFDEIGSDKEYIVEKVDDYTYKVIIESTTPIGKLEFNSIGGTTITNATYGFYIGGDVNISTLNLFDNGTYIDNFTIDVVTLDSYPGFNGTFTIAGNTETLENISNGSYRLDFSHGRYFSRSVYIDIVNSSQDAVYSTFQSVINVIARSLKIHEDRTNINITTYDNVTNFSSFAESGNYTIATLYLNASDYDLYIGVPLHVTLNDTISTDYFDNLTLIYNLSFIVTFFLMDEKYPDQVFDITAPDRVLFKLMCPDSTTDTLITNATQSVPITCEYDRFKFVLDYVFLVDGIPRTTTYYRSYIFDSTTWNNTFNITIYLIDLNTTTAILDVFFIDDLLQEYENPRIFIKKLIGSQYVQITADVVDVEDKINAFLIRYDEYLIEIYSDNLPTLVLGTYNADSEGEKNLRVYDITLESEPESFINDVTHWVGEENISNSTFARMYFNDDTGLVTNVQFNIFKDIYNGTLLFSASYPGNTSIDLLYNISPYINDTLYMEILYSYPDRGTYRAVHQKTGANAFRVALEVLSFITNSDYIVWFITLVMSVLAIMSTVKTANVMGLVILGFSAIFIIFGWYPLAWALWAVVLFISIVHVMKKGEDAV